MSLAWTRARQHSSSPRQNARRLTGLIIVGVVPLSVSNRVILLCHQRCIGPHDVLDCAHRQEFVYFSPGSFAEKVPICVSKYLKQFWQDPWFMVYH